MALVPPSRRAGARVMLVLRRDDRSRLCRSLGFRKGKSPAIYKAATLRTANCSNALPSVSFRFRPNSSIQMPSKLRATFLILSSPPTTQNISMDDPRMAPRTLRSIPTTKSDLCSGVM